MFGKKTDKKKKVKNSTKTAATIASQKPISQLTKEDKDVMQQRITEIHKFNKDSSTVQNSIAYNRMYEDGVCQVTENTFSKTIQFYDVSYRLAEFEEQNNIFSKYCDLINFFDNTIKFQLTFENQNRSQDKLVSEIQIEKQDDDFNDKFLKLIRIPLQHIWNITPNINANKAVLCGCSCARICICNNEILCIKFA